MIPPQNCPYKNLTAAPCWKCPHYMPDVDQCKLDWGTTQNTAYTAVRMNAQTYEERCLEYEKRRQELLQLSKEALVDLIIHRPTFY